jgi:alcohol dehydrogenase (cytochrome c)
MGEEASAPLLQSREAKTTKRFLSPLGWPNAITVDSERGFWVQEQRHDNKQEAAWLLDWNSKLAIAIIQTGVANSFEATPIEVNGILYIVTAGDHIQAYNAKTGEILWSYTPTLQYSNLCCGPEARGVAVAYGKVYVAELDASLVALDAKTGQLLWKTDPAKTLPPDPRLDLIAADNDELARISAHG